MNCAYHPDREVVGMCVSCGKPICQECKVLLRDKYYCNSCIAKMVLGKTEYSGIKVENISGWGWYLQVLKNYAVFDGRARRKEYWYFFLFNFIISFTIGFIEGFIEGLTGFGTGTTYSVFAIIYAVAVFLPSLGVVVRRLHDTGHSGWWYFILLIPIIGVIVFIIFMVRDSQEGTNQYGPSPKIGLTVEG